MTGWAKPCKQHTRRPPGDTSLKVTFAAGLLFWGSLLAALEIRDSVQGSPYLTYQGQVVYSYGPSPQRILLNLPAGNGNDYKAWVAWATQYRISNVRAYPPSVRAAQGAYDLFLATPDGKFDLERFNPDYCAELRTACELFRAHGMFVHLQLWQAVAWKKHWAHNYYNPINNISPQISAGAGPGEFMNVDKPALLEHQKRYVREILAATADLGNVIYDVANEIGNGTDSSSEWALLMIETIRRWQREHNTPVLITLNDEGGSRLSDVDSVFAELDLVVKDKGRYDQHIDSAQRWRKPTASVRNIDWNYAKRERLYFFAERNLEINTRPDYQIRGRKYWWRMFMAKVQMAGGYADTHTSQNYYVSKVANKLAAVFGITWFISDERHATYALNTLAETNFLHFRNFLDNVQDFPSLIPDEERVQGHPAAHSYTLFSPRELVVYFESPNGEAGINYPSASATLAELPVADGDYAGFFYHPANGTRVAAEVRVVGGELMLQVPEFSDDLALYISFAPAEAG